MACPLTMELPQGEPIPLSLLRDLGASYKDVERMVMQQQLYRLGSGVYTLPEYPVTLAGALHFLSQRVAGFHLAGHSALLPVCELGSHTHAGDQLVLWGNASYRLPAWFIHRFPARYANPGLFDWQRSALPGLADATVWRRPSLGAEASVPERAILEMLYEVDVKLDLRLATEWLSQRPPLRESLLGTLLECCRSIKTIRLFLTLARQLALLDVDQLTAHFRVADTNPARWTRRLRNGHLLTLKAGGQ